MDYDMRDTRQRYGGDRSMPPAAGPYQARYGTEYRPPPQRGQFGRGRGGPHGPSRDLGGPRGYDNTGGLGQSGEYDINLLLNLGKMLS